MRRLDSIKRVEFFECGKVAVAHCVEKGAIKKEKFEIGNVAKVLTALTANGIAVSSHFNKQFSEV